MMNYTKEPWPFGATPISSKNDALAIFKQSLDAHDGDLGGYFFEIFTEEGKRIAFLVGPAAEANSRRIVACVNACAGVPTKLLEMRTDMGAAEVSRLMELEQQRDRLMETLKDTLYALECWTGTDIRGQQAHALIKEIEGEG